MKLRTWLGRTADSGMVPNSFLILAMWGGDERYLTAAEVAEITRVGVETVRYWRRMGYGPPSVKLAKHVLYPESGLHAWIESKAEVGDTRASA
jgi:predicted DNA-binding transcriptional regulator AlpA